MIKHPIFLPELQYLRAIAILLTLIAHLAFVTVTPDPRYMHFVLNYGQFWGGVEIFFCLSGYIISRSLFPKFDERKNKIPVAKSFYIKRVTRLMPSAIFWASVVLMLSFLNFEGGHFGEPRDTFRHWLASVFFVQNIHLTLDIKVMPALAHYWSLAVEEQFYLVIPWLYIAIKSRKLFMATILGLLVMQAIIPRPVNQSLLLSELRYDAILYGVLIFLLEREGYLTRLFTWLKSHKILAWGAVAAASIGLVTAPILAQPISYAFTAVDFCAFIIVLLAVAQAGIFKVKIQGLDRIMLWFGSRSYGMYLCHIPVFLFCISVEKTWGLNVAPDTLTDPMLFVPFLLTALCSEFSYKIVENPIRNWGRSYVSQAKNRATKS